jgi:PAS domain S-box-containing protein
LLAANARDIVSRHAVDGAVLWVSDSISSVLGGRSEDYIGAFTEVVHRDDVASVQAALVTVNAGRSATVLFRVRHVTGAWRWLEALAVPWPDDAAIAEVHVISRDVTDRVLAERAQREAERRLEMAIEHAPIGMAIVALDGSWLRVNAALCRLVGYTRDEMLTRTFQEITHPDDLSPDLAYVQKLVDGEIDDYAMDKRYIRADGTIVWVHLSVTLLRDDEGAPLHFLSQIQDITERRMLIESLHGSVAQLTAANDALRDADEMKDHVLAVVSHELRSPLTSIIGFSDLLNTRWHELDDERRAELLTKVAAQGQRLRLLVEDLLTVSTIRSGQLALAPVACELEPLIRRSVDVHCPGSRVVVPPGAAVYADPQRVEQMLVNLLSNAMKYGEAPVAVVVGRQDDTIEVCVTDEGPGVASDFAPKLFQSFSQSSTGDRRMARGTGLGLAIVRELALAQGGAAWYVPNEPRGARFCFRLPAAVRTET